MRESQPKTWQFSYLAEAVVRLEAALGEEALKGKRAAEQAAGRAVDQDLARVRASTSISCFLSIWRAVGRPSIARNLRSPSVPYWYCTLETEKNE